MEEEEALRGGSSFDWQHQFKTFLSLLDLPPIYA
jgi:hypothetical protein